MFMEAKFQPYSFFPSNPLVFKFCFLFIILITLIFNNNTLWFISIMTPITHGILISIIYFITQSKEGLPQSKFQLTNGSGDTLYAWYALLFILIIATLGAFFWHFLKSRDKSIPL